MQDLLAREVSLKPLRDKHRAVYYTLVVAAWALVTFILLVDLLLLTSPINPWFQATVIISGSMEPAIMTGSMAIITREESYEVGDVITFADPLVGTNTHRIVGKGDFNGITFFRTKGDAVEDQDVIPVTMNRVKGKVRVVLPWFGYLAYAGFAAILVPLGMLVLYLFRKLRSRRNV